jgi:hypothetical protein
MRDRSDISSSAYKTLSMMAVYIVLLFCIFLGFYIISIIHYAELIWTS